MDGAGLPAFDIDGGVLLAVTRGLWVAALFSVFGALLFRAVVASPVLRQIGGDAGFERQWRALFWSSWAVAVAAAFAWLVLQAASLADANGVRAALSAVPDVVSDTRFGHVLLLQAGFLLLAVLAAASRTLWLATVFAGIALALHAAHGHAASMYDGVSVLLLSGIVHLLAAGAWLGSLAPLLLLAAALPADVAAQASRRFSHVGTACVALLAVTALYQGWVLIGSVAGLAGTGYGLTALLKGALFTALIGFAARNRFRLTPALAAVPGAQRRLLRSIAAETAVGILVVAAAGFMASMPPSMHVQPLWPFAQQLSLDAVREDAGFRVEVIEAGCALAGAALLLVAAVFYRRVRWPAVAVSLIVCWFAVPHLDLLLAEAHPTSFYVSPTHFAATGIADGAGLYAAHCAGCHGAEGHGNGPDAAGLAIPPADLTAAHLWMHSEGELFWWLSHGIDSPEGGLAMPGFAATLSDDQRWALIDYVRAHNAGLVRRETGEWSPPVQAPELQAQCGKDSVSLQDLRGDVVMLVFGTPAAVPMPGVAVIEAMPDAKPPASACVATDPSLRAAYAVVAGMPEAGLDGVEFLIDGQGWLRAMHPRVDQPEALAAEIQVIRDHPIAPPTTAKMDMAM